jgi:hypothetical protein
LRSGRSAGLGQLGPHLDLAGRVVGDPLERDQRRHRRRREQHRVLERGPRVVGVAELVGQDRRLLDRQVGALVVVDREPRLGVDQLDQVGPQAAAVEHPADRPQVGAQRRIAGQRAAEGLDRPRLVDQPALAQLAQLVGQVGDLRAIGRPRPRRAAGSARRRALPRRLAEIAQRALDRGRRLEALLEGTSLAGNTGSTAATAGSGASGSAITPDTSDTASASATSSGMPTSLSSPTPSASAGAASATATGAAARRRRDADDRRRTTAGRSPAASARAGADGGGRSDGTGGSGGRIAGGGGGMAGGGGGIACGGIAAWAARKLAGAASAAASRPRATRRPSTALRRRPPPARASSRARHDRRGHHADRPSPIDTMSSTGTISASIVATPSTAARADGGVAPRRQHRVGSWARAIVSCCIGRARIRGVGHLLYLTTACALPSTEPVDIWGFLPDA